ncbi:MAG TPA: 4-alpha-glucanotransferase [Gemmatimonadaceae bacterium]|nr:4-alpha-glucanotransferase [Gemmatimonadaceae bacterium]
MTMHYQQHDEAQGVERPMLRALADRKRIQASYVDQTGEKLRQTSDETRVRLLAAMGIDASTEERAREALRTLRRAERRQLIDPVRVVRQKSRRLSRVAVRLPTIDADEARWTLELRTEEGVSVRWSGTAQGGRSHRVDLELPVVPPLGYHDLTITVEGGGRRRSGTQRLIVVPSRCMAPELRLRGRRGFGITANLYTVRSHANWGAGDLGDLVTLSEWLGHQGGAFVGVNPLHALRNEGYDVSPYSPISRLFRNPLYLRVDDIPELAHDEKARAMIAAPHLQHELGELRAANMLDYGRVMALRAPVLEQLHRTFEVHELAEHTERGRAYESYVAREDPQLTQFATFMAIAEQEGPDARTWPEPLRDPRSPEVARRREALMHRVGYHTWLQFELDRQLGNAAHHAAEAGLALGLYQDLAVGSAPSGSDVWANPGLFRQGATVGAPPDMYSEEGQNWGLPAMDPFVLRETRYDYWIRLLRSGFRHTGALRIDHALGLFRMFWVPLGESARTGAYVTSFSEELFGIMALESMRHGAIVVGEDLGTVPPQVPRVLERWGVLGSKVVVFEGDFFTRRFRAANAYPRLALTTVNTHDLPPIVGWMRERDVTLRSELGDLSDEHQLGAARAARAADRGGVIELLIEEGLLPRSAHEQLEPEALVRAVHAFVRRTPAALVGLSLDDLALESEPVNIPGVWQDRYASWSRRMRVPLEELLQSPRTDELLGHEAPAEDSARQPT